MKRPRPATNWLIVLSCLLVVVVVALVAWHALDPRIQYLTRQLQTAKEAKDRAAAAKELGDMGAAARPAAQALVAALRDDGRYLTQALLIIPQEHYVNQDAYVALKRIGGPETVEALTEAMVASNQKVKNGTGEWHWRFDSLPAELLAELGPESRPAAERLLEAIDGCRQGEVVKQSVNALVAMDLKPNCPAAKKAREVLPQFCSWSDASGQLGGWVLYRLYPEDDEVLALYVRATISGTTPAGPGAVPLNDRTIPLLIQHLADGSRQGAITQLGAAELTQVLPYLQEALHNSESHIRAGAADLLARRGSSAAEAEPDLVPLISDESPEVRLSAAIALWQFSQNVELAVPVFAATTEENRIPDRLSNFLNKLGPTDAWAAPALAKLASTGNDKNVRLTSLDILGRIGPKAVESLPSLLEQLKDSDAEIQRAAAKAVTAVESK